MKNKVLCILIVVAHIFTLTAIFGRAGIAVAATDSSIEIKNRDAHNFEDNLEITVTLSADAASAKLFIDGELAQTILTGGLVTVPADFIKSIGSKEVVLITYDSGGAELEAVREELTVTGYIWPALKSDSCDNSDSWMYTASIMNNSETSNSGGGITRTAVTDPYDIENTVLRVGLGTKTWTSGNPYISLHDAGSVNLASTDHVITAVKLRALASKKVNRMYFETQSYNSSGVQSNSSPLYSIFSQSGTIGTGGSFTGPAYEAETWYDFEYVFNTIGNKIEIYVDGQLVGTPAYTTNEYTKGLFALRMLWNQQNISDGEEGYFLVDDIKIYRYSNPGTPLPNVSLHSYTINGDVLPYTGGTLSPMTEEIVFQASAPLENLEGNVKFIDLATMADVNADILFSGNDIIVRPEGGFAIGDYTLIIEKDAGFAGEKLPMKYEVNIHSRVEFSIQKPADGSEIEDCEHEIMVSNQDAVSLSLYADNVPVETKPGSEGPFFTFRHTPVYNAKNPTLTYKVVAVYADGETEERSVTVNIREIITSLKAATRASGWAELRSVLESAEYADAFADLLTYDKYINLKNKNRPFQLMFLEVGDYKNHSDIEAGFKAAVDAAYLEENPKPKQTGGTSSGGSSVSIPADIPIPPDIPDVNPITEEESCFEDLSSKHWGYAAIKALSEMEYMVGYPDGTFHPENNITRAEFAKVVLEVVKDIKGDADYQTPEHDNAKTKVACIGDDNTAGLISSSGIWTRDNSYCNILARLLGSDFEVMNFGVDATGISAEHGNLYFSTQEYETSLKSEPDIVVIIIGTNDIGIDRWDDVRDEYRGDYLRLIKSYQALYEQSRILVLPPPPVFGDKTQDRPSANLTEAIGYMREAAGEAGCQFIDTFPLFQEGGEMFPDGLHFNSAGADILARAVADAILSDVQERTETEGEQTIREFETSFFDVFDSDWFAEYIREAAGMGLIVGSEGYFRPNDTITREDAALVVFRALEYVGKTFNGIHVYADRSEISPYARDAVAALGSVGIVKGMGDNMFAPKNNLTRAETAQMMYNVLMYVK